MLPWIQATLLYLIYNSYLKKSLSINFHWNTFVETYKNMYGKLIAFMLNLFARSCQFPNPHGSLPFAALLGWISRKCYAKLSPFQHETTLGKGLWCFFQRKFEGFDDGVFTKQSCGIFQFFFETQNCPTNCTVWVEYYSESMDPLIENIVGYRLLKSFKRDWRYETVASRSWCTTPLAILRRVDGNFSWISWSI